MDNDRRVLSLNARRVRAILRLARNLLTRAENEVRWDTEYLRDDLFELRASVDILLSKMEIERLLLRDQDALHSGLEKEAECQKNKT